MTGICEALLIFVPLVPRRQDLLFEAWSILASFQWPNA